MAAGVLAQANANRLRDALERFGMEAVDTRDAIVDEQGINSIEEVAELMKGEATAGGEPDEPDPQTNPDQGRNHSVLERQRTATNAKKARFADGG